MLREDLSLTGSYLIIIYVVLICYNNMLGTIYSPMSMILAAKTDNLY